MSEQIGKHKGAVETLMHEKKELSRLLQIVNSQLEKHLAALEENGVDAEQFINQVQQGGQQQQQSSGNDRSSRKRSGSGQKSSSRKRSGSQSRDGGSSGRKGLRSRRTRSEESDDNSDERDFNPL